MMTEEQVRKIAKQESGAWAISFCFAVLMMGGLLLNDARKGAEKRLTALESRPTQLHGTLTTAADALKGLTAEGPTVTSDDPSFRMTFGPSDGSVTEPRLTDSAGHDSASKQPRYLSDGFQANIIDDTTNATADMVWTYLKAPQDCKSTLEMQLQTTHEGKRYRTRWEEVK
jgi:hypothetical protein